MEQMIKTYHNNDDETINADIKRLNSEGWVVRQQEYSSQILNEQLRSCVLVLYERTGKVKK